MNAQPKVFVSAINGARFDVTNPLTASLLSKNEKKDIIHQFKTPEKKARNQAKKDDNEQEIS